jgi:hypothetical protein
MHWTLKFEKASKIFAKLQNEFMEQKLFKNSWQYDIFPINWGETTHI